MFKTLWSKIKTAASIVWNTVVSVFTKSTKEEEVIIAGTADVVEETNAAIEDATTTLANIAVVAGVVSLTIFVVFNFPITVLFVMECVAVYQTVNWILNKMTTEVAKA